MAYNLPPPWDAGYALPENVRDEGLQRRGFVTKQMPRGTYDQPNVGTGGYAVPQYVLDEGYGQGTFTTKWEPRGEYDGGKIPYWLNNRPRVIAERRRRGGGRDITMAAPVTVARYGNGSAVAMSGTDQPLPPSIREYGIKAADYIIRRAAAVPAAQRTAFLRKMMDQLDLTLWNRTRDIARALVAKGATPGQAFRSALERALSAGIAAHLIAVAESGVPAKSGPLLGLGGYRGPSVMGAVRSVLGAVNRFTQESVSPVAALTQCPGFSWDPVKAAWIVTPAGQVDVRGPMNTACPPTTRCTGFSWDPSTGTWVTTPAGQPDVPAYFTTTTCPPAPYVGPTFDIGPFSFPCPPYNMQATGKPAPGFPCPWGVKLKFTPSTITEDQAAFILDALRKVSPRLLMPGSGGMGMGVGAQAAYFKDPKGMWDQSILRRMGFDDPGDGSIVPKTAVNGLNPIVRVKVPDSANYYALFISELGTVERPGFTVELGRWDSSWLSEIVDGIVEVVGAIRDFLHELACDLVNKPGASDAAKSSGNPYAVGVGIGMDISKESNCKRDPVLPPAVDSGFPILPLAIVGGAALIAVAVFSKKKKKAP